MTIGAATKMIAGGYKIITHGKARRQNNKGDGDSGTEGGTSDEGGSE